MKDYSLLLKAKLDPNTSDIEKDIANLGKKYPLKLMLSVDDKAVNQITEKINKVASGGTSGKSTVKIINLSNEMNALEQIQRKMAEIKSQVGNSAASYSISTSVNPDTGEQNLTRATISYTDAMKKKMQVGYEWVNLAKEGEKADMVWAETTNKFTQNIKAEEEAVKKATLAQEKFVEKSIQSAKEFQARFQGATGAEAEKGRGIAGQIIQTGQARQAAVVSGADVAVLAEYDAKLKTMNADLAVSKSALTGVSSTVRSWSAELGQAIKNTITYTMTTGALYMALSQLKEGIQFIKDLNKEMVNIQMVTGNTDEEINSLAIEYNSLAKEMGTTTIEIAKGESL